MVDGVTFRMWREYVGAWLQAFRDRPGAAERLEALAVAAYHADRQGLSIRCLRRGAQLSEDPTPFYVNLGALHYERAEYSDARDVFGQAVAHDFGNVDALRGRGMSHQNLGAYEAASYDYLAVLASDPTDHDSRLNLGLVYYAQGRLDDAAEQLRRVCDQEVVDWAEQYYAHFALGRVLIDGADFEGAEAAFARSIALNPDVGESYRFLGFSQENNGKRKEAIANYRRAIELDPNDAYAHLNVAELLTDQGEALDAIEHATRALEFFRRLGQREDQANAYWAIGWARYTNGELSESVVASRAALELEPSLMPVRFNLGLALLRNGQIDESRRVYEEAIAGPVTLWDLEVHGIDDLRELLREEPEIPRAAEILRSLEAKRTELSSMANGAAAELAPAPRPQPSI
jgi:tetratricopeptide (TPR) repeat protein